MIIAILCVVIILAIVIPIVVTAQSADNASKKRRLDVDEEVPEQLLFSGVSSLAVRQLQAFAVRLFGQ